MILLLIIVFFIPVLFFSSFLFNSFFLNVLMQCKKNILSFDIYEFLCFSFSFILDFKFYFLLGYSSSHFFYIYFSHVHIFFVTFSLPAYPACGLMSAEGVLADPCIFYNAHKSLCSCVSLVDCVCAPGKNHSLDTLKKKKRKIIILERGIEIEMKIKTKIAMKAKMRT